MATDMDMGITVVTVTDTATVINMVIIVGTVMVITVTDVAMFTV
jgi:hypothetical protein